MRLKTLMLASASLAAFSAPASAGIDGVLGEVQLYAFNFCPVDYVPADGQSIAISSNPALYSLYGVNFGGNGISHFNLPDMRGRVGVGDQPGVMNIGWLGGTETTLVPTPPAHSHFLIGSLGDPAQGDPSGAALPDKTFVANPSPLYSGSALSPGSTSTTVQMAADILSTEGSSQPFNQFQPSLAMQYCVRVTGVYPSRN